jgi:hypothetical protein
MERYNKNYLGKIRYRDPNVILLAQNWTQWEDFANTMNLWSNNNVDSGNCIFNKKFWEELIACFPLIRHRPHKRRHLQQFFVAAGTCLLSRSLVTIGGYTDRPTDPPLIRHGQYRKRRLQQFFYCCVIRCIATIRGDTHIDIQTHRLMRGIYEVHRRDGLRCHDICTYHV